MKNWILISALVLAIAGPGCSNKKEKSRVDEGNVIPERQVPAPVKAAFDAKYPDATAIIWEDATEGTTPTKKVKFKIDGKYWKAEFRPDGSLVKEKEDEVLVPGQ